MNKPQTQTQLSHGRVTSPSSRGAVAVDLGLLETWQVNEMEGGKNFPALTAGPFPAPYQTDSDSVTPPADGFILSENVGSSRSGVEGVNPDTYAAISISVPSFSARKNAGLSARRRAPRLLTTSARVSTLAGLLESRCKGIRPGAASAEALACSSASLFLT